jgi:hypothetical protein
VNDAHADADDNNDNDNDYDYDYDMSHVLSFATPGSDHRHASRF